MTDELSGPQLAAELEHLRGQLAEAREALHAIRNGDVDGVLVTGERGEQIYALSGADRVYRQLIETMSEGAATLSAGGVILYCNIRLAAMLGRPPEQVLGAALRDFLPPADQKAVDDILAQARTEPSRCEINLKSSQDRLMPVYLSASRLASEAEMVFCLVLVDLTEQKSQEQVVAAERLGRLILEQAAEAIIVCDEQGQIIRAGQVARRLCDGDPLQRPLLEVFPLRTDASEPFHFAPVLQGETLTNLDVALDRHGQELALILNAGPLVSGQQILGFVVTLIDITARKRAEQDLERRHQLLEAISRAQARFITNADAQDAFDRLLLDLLALTGSEYGFIGEVLFTGAGQPYLKTKAITNIAWSVATRAFYAEHAPIGMEFYNLETLFGAVLTSGESVIANQPGQDPRRGGLPQGHPPLDAFLGVPIRTGGQFTAMVGIANRRGGYDQRVIAFLEPLLATIGQLVGSRRSIAERERSDEALRASQQLIEGILNAIPVRVFWKDRNLIYRGCNAVFARDAGFADPKDIVGKDDYQMAWRDQADLYRGDDRQVIESGCAKVLIEEPQTTPDGNTITLLTSKMPLRDPGGEVSGVLGTYMDITERKLAEGQIMNQLLELQRWQDVMLGREDRVQELKREVNELCRRAGENARYQSQQAAPSDPEAVEPKP